MNRITVAALKKKKRGDCPLSSPKGKKGEKKKKGGGVSFLGRGIAELKKWKGRGKQRLLHHLTLSQNKKRGSRTLRKEERNAP